MLNQASNRRIDPTSQWCVGHPPQRWDISFSAKVAEKLKHLFTRREAPTTKVSPQTTSYPAKRAA